MGIIRQVQKVMRKNFYVRDELLACNYDTRYTSDLWGDRLGMTLDILNGADDPLAMDAVSGFLTKARILHEVKGTQILIEFEINRGLTFVRK
jgi:hypothetical protein